MSITIRFTEKVRKEIMNICGEIQYNGVHSDICLGHDIAEMKVSDETREFLHACLDEWLNKSEGSGFFWLGEAEQIQENFREDCVSLTEAQRKLLVKVLERAVLPVTELCEAQEFIKKLEKLA